MSEFQVAGRSGRSEKESVVVRIRQVFAPDIDAYGSEIQTGMGVQQCVKRLVESVVLAPIDFSGSRGIHAEEIAFYLMVFQRLFVFHTCRERVHGDKRHMVAVIVHRLLRCFRPGFLRFIAFEYGVRVAV